VSYKGFYLWLLVYISQIFVCEGQTSIYLSPKGNDKNPGTRDLPFSTLQKAKEKVVGILKENPAQEIKVWLDDGIYPVTNPEIFRSQDSGKEGFAVQYKAIPGAVPVISGGKRLTSWTKSSDGIWETSISSNNIGLHQVRELYIDNKRVKRARHPNSDYLRIEKVGKDKRTNFYFKPEDFPIPENIDDTELVLMHDWSSSRVYLDTIILNKNFLKAQDTIGARQPSFFTLDNWEKNPRYYLENAREFIDEDFEWCFDSNDQKIFLKLPGSLHPNSMNVIIPYSLGIMEFAGTEGHPVANISFDSITFSHCHWQIPDRGYAGVQACFFDPWPSGNTWEAVPAAISGKWMKNISFINCTFEHLGGTGLWMGTGSINCSVINSIFSDISGNGIMIGEGRSRVINGSPWWKTAPTQAAYGNRIKNCTINNCGYQFFGGVGIWCGLTAYTSIIGNEISNLPYTGISIGWMWNPEPTPCKNNLIEGNHIHHIMQKLSDGGGIYMLGLQPGSRISHNHIHDVQLNAGRAESNGIFLDEGITDVVVEDNLIYNIAKSPIRFHKANYNLVKDNVLVCFDTTLAIQYNNTDPDKIEKVNNRLLKNSNIEETLDLDVILKEWNSQGYK